MQFLVSHASTSGDSSMMIEEEAPGFNLAKDKLKFSEGLEDDAMEPEMTESDGPKRNHSKDCLTFCRKLSGIMLSQLSSKFNVCSEIIRLNAKAIGSLLRLLDLEEVEPIELEKLQTDILYQSWTQFKDLMTYRKNKKICIVKQEYWDLIFDKSVAIEEYQKIFAKIIGSEEKTYASRLLKDTNFCVILSRMLYASNKLMALISILKDSTEKGASLRDLSTIDNFVILMLYPQHFKHYNHRGGKFALECCDKCKICGSKTVPKDFLLLLNDSRRRSEQLICELNGILDGFYSNHIGAVTSLMDIAVNNF